MFMIVHSEKQKECILFIRCEIVVMFCEFLIFKIIKLLQHLYLSNLLSLFTLLVDSYTYVCIYTYIPKYNMLRTYNVTCYSHFQK